MSKKYDLFTNENELVLTKLVQTYLSYYKIKKEFIEARDSFFQELYEEFPEYKKKVSEEKKEIIEELDKKQEQIQSVKEDDIKENTKCSSIFHKIALLTHPDKKQNINPEYFQQAQVANEKGKLGKLFFISRFLQIPLGDLSAEEIQNIQESIEKKEKKIEHYKKTYPYVYKYTENIEIRKKLLEAFRKLDQPKKDSV